MNTELSYLYRDASNYKQRGEVVLAGEMAESEARNALWEEVYFIPSVVGLPNLQHLFREQGFPFPTEDDHLWHEVESIRPTGGAPTVALSAAELLRRLTECRAAGWESYLLAAEAEVWGESKSVPRSAQSPIWLWSNTGSTRDGCRSVRIHTPRRGTSRPAGRRLSKKFFS